MTRTEIIKNTAAEIVALHDQDALDESVVELLLMAMALEIDNIAFMRDFDSMDRALRAIEGHGDNTMMASEDDPREDR